VCSSVLWRNKRSEVPRYMCPIAREVASSVYALYNGITRGQSRSRRHSEDQAGWDMVYLSPVVQGGELLVTWVVGTWNSSQLLRLCK
jgi:hypothetical protein